jgi:hypothetical protein
MRPCRIEETHAVDVAGRGRAHAPTDVRRRCRSATAARLRATGAVPHVVVGEQPGRPGHDLAEERIGPVSCSTNAGFGSAGGSSGTMVAARSSDSEVRSRSQTQWLRDLVGEESSASDRRRADDLADNPSNDRMW